MPFDDDPFDGYGGTPAEFVASERHERLMAENYPDGPCRSTAHYRRVLDEDPPVSRADAEWEAVEDARTGEGFVDR